MPFTESILDEKLDKRDILIALPITLIVIFFILSLSWQSSSQNTLNINKNDAKMIYLTAYGATINTVNASTNTTGPSTSTNPTNNNSGNWINLNASHTDGTDTNAHITYFCKTNALGTCTLPYSVSCTGGQWCNSPSSTNTMQNCTKAITPSETAGNYSFWAFAVTSLCNVSSSMIGNFSVNHPPTITAPTISGTYYTDSTITCTAGTASDPDTVPPDNPVVNAYRWYFDDVEVSGQTSSTLNCGTVSGCNKNVVVKCDNNAKDTHNYVGDYSAKSSGNTIQNSVPTVSSQTVFQNFTNAHSFYANATGADADGLTDIWACRAFFWKNVNSAGTKAGTYTSETGKCVVTINYSDSDGGGQIGVKSNVNVTVEFNDTAGAKVNTTTYSHFVINHAPTIAVPSITAGNYVNNSIINCTAGTKTDADGDSTFPSFRWYRNGTVVSGQEAIGLNCASVGCAYKANISCDNNVTDTYDYSSYSGQSGNVTIGYNTINSIYVAYSDPAAPNTNDIIWIGLNVTDGDMGQTLNCSLSGDLSGYWNTTITNGGNTTVNISIGTQAIGQFYYNVTCTDGISSNTSLNNLLNVEAFGTNYAPVVGAIMCDDNIDLNDGSVKVITCNATIHDDNGCSDINTVSGKFWDSGSTTETEADNPAMHYSNGSCKKISCTSSSTQGTASCAFSIQFYANATSWNASITADDGIASAVTNRTNALWDINTLRALSISTTNINFSQTIVGTFSPGLTSTSDFTVTVTNTGNTKMDAQVNGTAMACEQGTSIPVGNIHYSATSLQAYSSMCSLGSNPDSTCSELNSTFDLAKGASSTKNTYWKLYMPSGVIGSCQGGIEFNPIAG